jgi:putative FmdB family regulatory protein
LASRSKIDEKQSGLPVQPAFIFEDQGIRNLKPLALEPPVYSSGQDRQDGNGDTLELISVMPGPLGRTKVISFANNRAWAGPGAVQSLTDPAFARVVVQKLRGPSGEMPPFYQIVIRISYRGGTAVNSSYVTHRALTVARSSPESPIAPWRFERSLLVTISRSEMPIYEYQCRKCAAEFELLVLPASPVPACPSCQSPDIEQLLSGFAVSSDGIRKAHIQAARRKSANGSQVRDQKAAQAEYFQKERAEHGG